MIYCASFKKHDDGFSIFESLVAFLILSMVLAGSIQLISSTSRVLGTAKNYTSERSAILKVRSELARLMAEDDDLTASEIVLMNRKVRVDLIIDDQFLVGEYRLFRIQIWPPDEANVQAGQSYLGYLSLFERSID